MSKSHNRASHFKNDSYLEYLARVISELAGPQPQWYLPAMSTKHGGYQPLSGWYQLDKVNINKFPNMLPLEQTASD